MFSSSCVYLCSFKHGWNPATVLSYEGTKSKVSVSVPSSSLSGGGKGILEKGNVDTYEIPKRGSKIT